MRYIAATATINRMLGYHVGVRRPGTRSKSKTSFAKTGAPSSTNAMNAGRIRRASYVTGRVWISGRRFVQPRQHALLGHSPLVVAQMRRVDELISRWMKREFDHALAAANLPPGLLASLRSRRVRSAVKMYEMSAHEPPPDLALTPK